MKFTGWFLWVAAVLLGASAVLYAFHWYIFRDAYHIFIYMVGDIAFLPIEVLLVTLVIHRVLSHREKRVLLEKMNMVVEVFFSEVGCGLLKLLDAFREGARAAPPATDLLVGANWTDRRFRKTAKELSGYKPAMDARRGDLAELRRFLSDKQDFLLGLLENPNILEHDSFTNVLWAVFHLADELAHRDKVTGLPASDYRHLSGDLTRVYGLLVVEWLAYMHHLKNKYPYLFSLAVRTNPFDPGASPVVKE